MLLIMFISLMWPITTNESYLPLIILSIIVSKILVTMYFKSFTIIFKRKRAVGGQSQSCSF